VAATTQQFGATTIPGSYFTPPTALQTRVLTAATTGTATSTSTPSGTVAAPANLLNKEDIRRRVKERRRQLSEEIAKAKIQLWETTIEQGVSTHFEKHLGCGPLHAWQVRVLFGMWERHELIVFSHILSLPKEHQRTLQDSLSVGIQEILKQKGNSKIQNYFLLQLIH